jgi:hypothetical protein
MPTVQLGLLVHQVVRVELLAHQAGHKLSFYFIQKLSFRSTGQTIVQTPHNIMSLTNERQDLQYF